MTQANRFRLSFAPDGVIEIAAYVPGTKGPESRRLIQDGTPGERLAAAMVWIGSRRGLVTTPVATENVPDVPLADPDTYERDTGV